MTAKTTKRYDSVGDMLKGIDVDREFVDAHRDRVEAKRLSARLQALRVEAGLTQRELGERLEITQGAVSKIEHKADDDLTLKELASWMSACSATMHLTLGRPLNKVERIKHHAFQIRSLLDELADTAGEDAEIRKGVEDFWMEVVVNLTSLLSRSKAVPHENIADLFRVRESTSEPARTREMEYTLPEEPEPEAHPSHGFRT